MIFKALRVHKEIEERQKEEYDRATYEKERKKELAKLLWQSYNNNVKLWSLTAFTDLKEPDIDKP